MTLPPTGPLTTVQVSDLLGSIKTLSVPDEDLATFVARLSPSSSSTSRTRPWRVPSVATALGVPSIQRAVSLISSTTGMLSVQGFQNGAVMGEPPRLILRPDPYQTPQAFYAGTSAQMAKYGEFVWWIAKLDGAGFPASLVLVPLNELEVKENPTDRMLPEYRWGNKKKGDQKVGTRFSGANKAGRFVHVMYPLAEPLALRGAGPLQICGAAASVSVEAQQWAANFYAEGGLPSVVIKHAAELDPTEDDDGYNEAERLRNQFMEKSHNVPRVIDQNIESIDYLTPNAQGAQMLESRMRQDGESARMFGIPGSLLEYSVPGSSLTYQNLEGEFTKFVRTCLQPLYLEPIEQALSDLLPRAVTARFNVKGFLRADIRTRFDVHKIAIDAGIYDPAYAQQEEGILPGDVEYQPIPFSPPQALPPAVPRAATAPSGRSLAMHDVRCPTCQRLVVRSVGPVEGWCRHCKATVQGGEPIPAAEPSGDLTALTALVAALAGRDQSPGVTIADGAIRVSVPAPDMSLIAEAIRASAPVPAPVEITNIVPGEKGLLDEGGPVAAALVSIAETQQQIVDNVVALRNKPPGRKVVERNKAGQIVAFQEESA